MGQLCSAELTLGNVRTEVAAIPEGDDMISIHIDLRIASSNIIFIKILVDLAGNGEPAQRVRPQIAEIRFALARGIVCSGEHNTAVGLQRVVQLDLIAMRVNKRGSRRGHDG